MSTRATREEYSSWESRTAVSTIEWTGRRFNEIGVSDDDWSEAIEDSEEYFYENRSKENIPLGDPGAVAVLVESIWKFRDNPEYEKRYSSTVQFLGIRIEIGQAAAFERAVMDIERQISEDPPSNYVQQAQEDLARRQSDAASVTPSDEENSRTDSQARRRMGSPSELVEKLIDMKSRAIRLYPISEVGGQQGAMDAALAGRSSTYNELLSEELGVTISRIVFDANVSGDTRTHIFYNLDPESGAQEGPRSLIGQNVSNAIQQRWSEINLISETGDLPEAGPTPQERLAALQSEVGAAVRLDESLIYVEIIDQLLGEIETIRQDIIRQHEAAYPVAPFPSPDFVNEEYDELKLQLGIMNKKLGPEAFSVQVYISLVQEPSLIDPDWSGRVEGFRAFIQSIRVELNRIDQLVADDARLRDEEVRRLASAPDPDVRGQLLNSKYFIVVDGKGRSIEFKLPIRKGDKSIQVQVIKRFLGFDPSDGDVFDEKTKKSLLSWQDSKVNDLYDLALKDLQADQLPTPVQPAMNEELAADYGQVGPLSFLIMQREGAIAIALGEVYDHNINNAGAIVDPLTPPDIPKNALEKRIIGDGENPPWSDGKYHYYIYNTRATREDINSDKPETLQRWYSEHAEEALRTSVLALCDYHARSKTWKVYGNREEHRVYDSILMYQNKIQQKMADDQVFTMTVVGQSLAENLGYREDENTPKVDVLFGQSLTAGAHPNFANVERFHGPTRRPNSTWKLEIRVRRDLFDKIPTIESRTFTIGQTIAAARDAANAIGEAVASFPDRAADAGQAANERKEAIVNEINDRASGVAKGMQWAKKNKKEAIEQGAASAWGAAKKYSRNAEMAKQFGSGVGPLALSKAQQSAFIAQIEAMQSDVESYPTNVFYPLNKVNEMIEKVAEMFDTFQVEVQGWRKNGGRMRPYVDMSEEAKHLRALKPALTSLLSGNGYVKRDYMRGDNGLWMNFEEVPMIRSIPMPPFAAGPNAGKPQEPIKVSDTAGGICLFADYEPEGKDKIPMLQGTIALGQKYPFNVPRTMHYFMNLHSLYEKANNFAASCLMGDGPQSLDPAINALDVMQKFTRPSLIILPREPKPIFDIKEPKIDIAGPIKRADERLKEDLNLEGNGPLARRWREGIIRVERNKTYAIVDPVPTIELCTLDALFEEFLDKFDFPALFCDYASCIPDLPWPPHFNWDFNFKIPELPRIPSFDPMAIIIPRIELALADLILSFLCGLVRGILDLIRFPDCQDLLEFGKAAWEDLWPGEKNGQKLKVMQDAATVLQEMDIPQDAYPGLADLFDDLAIALAPAELCSLLDGTADAEVLAIVMELIRTKHQSLANYFRNEADITTFFMLLGKFVDPDLCNRVSNTSNIILGDVLCPDPNSNTSLRSRLESERATSEEISSALADAAERREALKSLFDKDPLDGMIPSPGEAGMPSPYDNDLSKQMAELAIKTVLENVELMVKNDLVSYVPSLTDTVYSQMGEGDPGFDPIASAEYEFVKQQVQSMEGQSEEIGDMAQIIDDFDEANDEIRVFSELFLGAVFTIADYSVQRGRDMHTRYYVRLGNVETGTAVPNGGVGTGGIHKERVLSVIRADIARRQEGANKIQQPSNLRLRQNGEKYCEARLDAEGNYVYFDLQDPQDIKTITDIMTFPLRNISPDAKVLPWLQDILENPDLMTVRNGVQVDFIRKRAESAFDFINPNMQYVPSPESRRRVEDRNLEIKIPVDSEGSSFITYQEIPFENEDIKDCYNIHRPSRLLTEGSSVSLWKGRTFTSSIPEDIRQIRLAARDIAQARFKLARPGAFADMFLDSWTEIRNSIDPNEADISPNVEGFNNPVWNKLQGFVDPSDEVATSAYEHMVDKFQEKITNKISESRFFNTEQLMELGNLITAEFIESTDSEGNICFVENEPFVDFEKIRKELVEKYTQSLSSSENLPENRDFSKPGPLENSMGSHMCLLYAKTYVIEFLLRGLFVFSEYGPEGFFNNDFIKEYFSDFLLDSVNTDMSLDMASREQFLEEIRKAGNDTDLKIAIKTIISQVMEDQTFIETINRVFAPRSNSFKEEYLVELMAGARSVQPLKNIAPRTRNRLSGTRRGFVPLHNSFGGLHAAPLGGTDTDALKDLEQGKFYVETYYRFSEEVVNQWIAPGDSFMKRFTGSNMIEDLYSPMQFAGVFSDVELISLLRAVSEIDSDPMTNMPDFGITRFEFNDFLRSISALGGMKAGMRLVFLPGKMSGEFITRNQEDSGWGAPNVDGIVNSRNAINEGDLFTNSLALGGNPAQLSGFILPDDIPTQAEAMAIGMRIALGNATREDREALERFQQAMATIPNLENQYIDELLLTAKTRSYIADTHPRIDTDVPMRRNALGGMTPWRNRWNNPSYPYGSSHILVRTLNIDVEGQDENVEEYTPYSSGTPKNIMFPTPIVTKEMDICGGDMLNEIANNWYAAALAARDHTYTLGFEMFGVRNTTPMISPSWKMEGDPSTEIKYLFDFIFPLDRYQALYLMQNQILMDKSEKLSTLMDPSRATIKKLALTLRNVDTFGMDSQNKTSGSKLRSVLISDQASDGAGKKASFALGDMAPMIAKMAAMTIPTLIRGQAAYLDPAYKELKKQFDDDVCKMRAGMTVPVLRGGPTYTPPWRDGEVILDGGFDDSGAYSPLNLQGPVDLSIALGSIAAAALGNPAAVVALPHNIGELLRIVEHLSNSVTGGERRYGKLLTPVGILALGMPELQGEQYRTKKREAKCRDGERTAPEFKICEDEQEEEEQ